MASFAVCVVNSSLKGRQASCLHKNVKGNTKRQNPFLFLPLKPKLRNHLLILTATIKYNVCIMLFSWQGTFNGCYLYWLVTRGLLKNATALLFQSLSASGFSISLQSSWFLIPPAGDWRSHHAQTQFCGLNHSTLSVPWLPWAHVYPLPRKGVNASKLQQKRNHKLLEEKPGILCNSYFYSR